MSDSNDQANQMRYSLNLVETFDSGTGEGGSEVVVTEGGLLYVTNGEAGRIDIFQPGTAGTVGQIALGGLPDSIGWVARLRRVDFRGGQGRHRCGRTRR